MTCDCCRHRAVSRTPGRCRSGWPTRLSCYTLWNKTVTSVRAALTPRTTWLRSFT